MLYIVLKLNIMKKNQIILLALIFVNSLLFAQDIPAQLNEAIRLQDQYKESIALQKFDNIIRKDPENMIALQHASYLYSIEGERKKTETEKRSYFVIAKKYAEKALSLETENAENHYNLALALGKISLLSGSEEKLRYAKQIKTEAEIAIKINPKHAPSFHVLGRLNREIANMSSIKVMAAKALFGGVPETCTFEKAENYFIKAIANRPNYILYYYDAALNASYMNKNAEAKKYLEKALSLPMLTPDDPYRVQDCKALLKKLN